MPKVKAEKSEIYYREFGHGDTLVFVPGLGAHSRIWGPFPKVFVVNLITEFL